MNQRIRELTEQAERLAKDELAYLERVHNRLYSFTEGREIYNQKFAELIVRECVQTLIDNTPERYTNESAEEDWDKGYDRAMKDCVHHIQEHFGVEE